MKQNESDEAKKIITMLLDLPENRICADCKAKVSKWASINLGVFICIDCSGVHRSLGTHISFVRSCTLDTWTMEQAAAMANIGNKIANNYWEGNLPNDFQRPLTSNRMQLALFIKQKYTDKKWALPGNPPIANPTVDSSFISMQQPKKHRRKKVKTPNPESQHNKLEISPKKTPIRSNSQNIFTKQNHEPNSWSAEGEEDKNIKERRKSNHFSDGESPVFISENSVKALKTDEQAIPEVLQEEESSEKTEEETKQEKEITNKEEEQEKTEEANLKETKENENQETKIEVKVEEEVKEQIIEEIREEIIKLPDENRENEPKEEQKEIKVNKEEAPIEETEKETTENILEEETINKEEETVSKIENEKEETTENKKETEEKVSEENKQEETKEVDPFLDVDDDFFDVEPPKFVAPVVKPTKVIEQKHVEKVEKPKQQTIVDPFEDDLDDFFKESPEPKIVKTHIPNPTGIKRKTPAKVPTPNPIRVKAVAQTPVKQKSKPLPRPGQQQTKKVHKHHKRREEKQDTSTEAVQAQKPVAAPVVPTPQQTEETLEQIDDFFDELEREETSKTKEVNLDNFFVEEPEVKRIIPRPVAAFSSSRKPGIKPPSRLLKKMKSRGKVLSLQRHHHHHDEYDDDYNM